MSTITIFDLTGKPKQLAEALAKGGEGIVYPLADRSDILVKCYHPDILAKNGPVLRQKVEAMITIKSQFASEQLSWPLLSVFDAQGQWIGYAMRRVAGVKLHSLAHALLYQKYFPQLTRKDVVTVLLGLIEQVQQLHAQQVMIGDYNLNNFLCDPHTLKVGLIDCDSYQVMIANQHYPCPVGSPDLTPSEHHGQSYAHIVRQPQSEVFSLAIILFKCLMLGRHPYDAVGGEDPVSNLKAGRFPYGIGNSGIPKGQWYNIWSHMPHRIKNLFIQTFVDGATNPSKRPDLNTWYQALTLYGQELDKDWHLSDMRPTTAKPAGRKGNHNDRPASGSSAKQV